MAKKKANIRTPTPKSIALAALHKRMKARRITFYDLLGEEEDPDAPGFDWSPVIERSVELGPSGGDTVLPPLTVYVPPGTYRFSKSLVLRRRVRLVGEGEDSILLFDNGVHGVVCMFALALTNRSDGSILEHLAIHAPGAQDPTADANGIMVYAPVKVRDVEIHGFVKGIHFFGDLGSPDRPSSASLSSIRDVWIQGCSYHGIHAEGPDANVITAIACQSSDNGVRDPRGRGVQDDGFLGSNWISIHTNNNPGGSFGTRLDNQNSAAMFAGCYGEVNQPPADIAPPGLVVGGALATTSTTLGAISLSGFELNLRRVAVGDEFFARLGGTVDNSVFEFGERLTNTNYGSRARGTTFRLMRAPRIWGTNPTGWYGLIYEQYENGCVMGFCDLDSPDYALGFQSHPKIWFPQSFMFGFEHGRVMMTAGTSPPPDPGNYPKNMIVWNTDPGPGRPTHWQCLRETSDAEPRGAWIAGPVYPSQAPTT